MIAWRAALPLIALAGLANADAAPPANLCGSGETAYFSCLVKGKKVLGLCGSLPSALQYRFGTSARTELRYPEDPKQGPRELRLAHYARYQTDRVEVSFQNGGVDYALFDYTENARRTAGVRVTAADGQEKEIRCLGAITGDLGALAPYLPCDADNALSGGVCPPVGAAK